MLAEPSLRFWVVAFSEMIALLLIIRVWRTGLGSLEKSALSLLALVPIVGPFFAWWLCHDPGPAHPALQAKGPRGTMTDRWRLVTEEPDPQRRAGKLFAIVAYFRRHRA